MARKKYTAGAGQKFIQKRQLSSPSMFLQLLKKSILGKNLGGEMLKPVNKEKNPGLAKLPEKVRNKMGYAKKGKMLKATKGISVKDDDKKDVKVEFRAGKKFKKKGPVQKVNITKASIGGEMKSTKGYGAARTSGMGLQDENLIPGKSMDYYKDLM